MPQQVDDLLRRGFLRIEKVVDAHVDEHLLVVRFEVFVVVDPRDRFTGAELFGQHRRHDVRSLFGQYGDIQVGFADGRFFQGRKSRAIPFDDDDVYHSGDRLEPFRVVVDDRYFVVFAAQHFGQVAAHFADSGDYDFHIPFVLFFVFESKYPFQQFFRQFELWVEPVAGRVIQ